MTIKLFNAPSKQSIFQGFVFSILGISALAISGISYQTTRDFIATANTAEGTVMTLEKSSSSTSKPNRNAKFHPVVHFTTTTGETIQFRSNFGSYPAAYRPGDKVSILYPPDNPQQATINSFFPLWFLTLIFAILGGSFTISGVSILWFKFLGKPN